MISELHPIMNEFIEWRRIHSFPAYSVSATGLVRNDETGRRMTMLVNQAGVVNVGLTKNRVQYKRAVALLVAKAFLTVVLQDTFDTPVNLDGDRYNNWVGNLVLRPRWYATKYFQQFHEEPIKDYPIEDVDSGEMFDSAWDATTRLGLLQSDIVLSVHTGARVWPTNQRFRPLR
jgi:hypothetical protein